MLAVGVDMIEIARIEQAQARFGRRFQDRFFTAQELAYCGGRPQRLAGRFVIKEAVAKALGTGIGDIRWKDVETVPGENGRPELVLHNEARRLAEERGLRRWAISLTHTTTYAVGFVVAQQGETAAAPDELL